MGLVWNFSAAVATVAVILIFGAIINKAREKKDSPIYKIINKFKRKKPEDDMELYQEHYRRLSHKGGLKWGFFII